MAHSLSYSMNVVFLFPFSLFFWSSFLLYLFLFTRYWYEWAHLILTYFFKNLVNLSYIYLTRVVKDTSLHPNKLNATCSLTRSSLQLIFLLTMQTHSISTIYWLRERLALIKSNVTWRRSLSVTRPSIDSQGSYKSLLMWLVFRWIYHLEQCSPLTRSLRPQVYTDTTELTRVKVSRVSIASDYSIILTTILFASSCVHFSLPLSCLSFDSLFQSTFSLCLALVVKWCSRRKHQRRFRSPVAGHVFSCCSLTCTCLHCFYR